MIQLSITWARRWAGEGAEVEVEVNSLDPGWVPTKMGGAGASGSLERAVETYVRLAEGCGRSGGYWKPGAREARPSAVCEEERWQEELFKVCERETGVRLPGKWESERVKVVDGFAMR